MSEPDYEEQAKRIRRALLEASLCTAELGLALPQPPGR